MAGISRFIDAQEEMYEVALNEIKNGHKESHWMWYIFPQIKGLGYSDLSIRYAIENIDEAKEFLNNPILGPRLIEICNALLELDSDDANAVFGYPDDMKLKSCMTLFNSADSNIYQFREVLEKFFDGEEDEKTITILFSQSKDNVLFYYETRSCFFPIGKGASVTIKNSSIKENVEITVRDENTSDEVIKKYSIPLDDYSTIFEFIHNSDRLYEALENPEYAVLDGTIETFYYTDFQRKTRYFTEYNFFFEYDGIDENSNAGELIKLCKLIKSILEKNGIVFKYFYI